MLIGRPPCAPTRGLAACPAPQRADWSVERHPDVLLATPRGRHSPPATAWCPVPGCRGRTLGTEVGVLSAHLPPPPLPRTPSPRPQPHSRGSDLEKVSLSRSCLRGEGKLRHDGGGTQGCEVVHRVMRWHTAGAAAASGSFCAPRWSGRKIGRSGCRQHSWGGGQRGAAGIPPPKH